MNRVVPAAVVSLRVHAAPDLFKGTFSATHVAESIRSSPHTTAEGDALPDIEDHGGLAGASRPTIPDAAGAVSDPIAATDSGRHAAQITA